MSERKFESGTVGFLPRHSGDGYSFGGGAIVTIGNRSISLGEDDSELANLLASAPDLQTAALRMLNALSNIPHGLIDEDTIADLVDALNKSHGRATP